MLLACTSSIIYRVIKKNYYRPAPLEKGGLSRIIVTAFFIMVYGVTLEYLGFFISTLVLSSTYLRFLKVDVLRSVLVGFIFAMLALLMFPVLLLIPLPRGYGVFHDITTYMLALFGR